MRVLVVLLWFYLQIAVVVEAAIFCGQALFPQWRQALAWLQTMWGGLHKARGSQTTTLACGPFVWITTRLLQKYPQAYPQKMREGGKTRAGLCTRLVRRPQKKARRPCRDAGPWVMPVFLCTAGDALPCTRRAHWAGGGRGLPSPPRWPPCGPCACRPSPPCFMPMRCWPRTARASKVFCCAGVRAA